MKPQNILLHTYNLQASQEQPYHIHQSVIHILFTQSDSIIFSTSPDRSLELPAYSSYLFFDQIRDFHLSISASKNAVLYSLEIPIDILHAMISEGVDELNFSNTDIFGKDRYHKFDNNSEALNECLAEFAQLKNPLLREAKKFELLSHYFNNNDIVTYKCPFLNQKDNVNKIREAKDILIRDLRKAPTIKELSRIIGLNEYHLKTGFKEIYTKPIYTFLKDYRLNNAKRMIDEGNYRINEIAELIGYNNVSHFIEAFRKKYGRTPKQYELNQK